MMPTGRAWRCSTSTTSSSTLTVTSEYLSNTLHTVVRLIRKKEGDQFSNALTSSRSSRTGGSSLSSKSLSSSSSSSLSSSTLPPWRARRHTTTTTASTAIPHGTLGNKRPRLWNSSARRLRAPTRRQFSTSTGSQAGTASHPPAPLAAKMLTPFLSELDRISPSVDVDGSQITILKTPADFYGTLKTKIHAAKRRIFLSTLYIGKTEQELIETLQKAMRANPNVKLSILTDMLRGTREAPDPSCASLLVPLIEEFGAARVEVRMYHTPNLSGIRKKMVPRRINEGWGLQHMKLYGVDDEVILTGANLSTDYFTNRQDRYHLFSSKEVTDYFFRIQQAVSSFSFLIEPAPNSAAGFHSYWPPTNTAPNPLKEPKTFVAHTTKAINTLIAPPPPPTPSEQDGRPYTKNTRVYLLTQLSQVMDPDTSTELPTLTHVLHTLSREEYARSRWTFTAGYFNPASRLTQLLLGTRSSSSTVITAHPAANGFFRSTGVSGMLPDAYTLLARRFLNSVHRADRDGAVTLREWRRGTVGQPDGWTYHAKGLWVTMPDEANPSMTLVGSSNYTKRSYSLDLEAGALVVTCDDDLKERLGQEESWIREHTTPVTRDDLARNERRVGLKVRVAMWIVSVLGGAL